MFRHDSKKKRMKGGRRKQKRGEGEKKEPQEEKGGNAKKEVNFEGDFFVLKAVSKYIFTLLFCCIFPRCAFFFFIPLLEAVKISQKNTHIRKLRNNPK